MEAKLVSKNGSISKVQVIGYTKTDTKSVICEFAAKSVSKTAKAIGSLYGCYNQQWQFIVTVEEVE